MGNWLTWVQLKWSIKLSVKLYCNINVVFIKSNSDVTLTFVTYCFLTGFLYLQLNRCINNFIWQKFLTVNWVKKI